MTLYDQVFLSKTLNPTLLLMVRSSCIAAIDHFFLDNKRLSVLSDQVNCSAQQHLMCDVILWVCFCVEGVPGGNGRGEILQPEAWRRQNPRHQAEQEGWVHTESHSREHASWLGWIGGHLLKKRADWHTDQLYACMNLHLAGWLNCNRAKTH